MPALVSYILGTLGWVVVHKDDGDSNCGLGIMRKKIIVAEEVHSSVGGK